MDLPVIRAEVFDPERAYLLLSNHQNYRNVRRSQVDRIRAAIREGRWRVDEGTPIRIDRLSKQLVDGQHRLTALFEESATLKMYVQYVEPGWWGNEESPRTNVDYVRAKTDSANASSDAAAAQFVDAVERGAPWSSILKSIPNETCARVVTKWKPELDWAREALGSRWDGEPKSFPYGGAPVIAAFAIGHANYRGPAETLAADCRSGGPDASPAALALRRFVARGLKMSTAGRAALFVASARSLQAQVNREPIKLLRVEATGGETGAQFSLSDTWQRVTPWLMRRANGKH